MLIPDHNNEYCRQTIVNEGECCCNCIYRYLLVNDEGFPMGYYCRHPVIGNTPIFISYDGHSMCEMHQRETDIPIEEMTII